MKVSKEDLGKAFEQVREEEIAKIQDIYKDNKELNQRIESSMKNTDWLKLYQEAQKIQKFEGIQKVKGKKFYKWYRAAAILLLIFAMGSVTAVAVVTIREADVKWKQVWGSKDDDFQFEANHPVGTASPDMAPTEMPKRIERRYQPMYMPEGYQKTEENRQDDSYSILYEQGEERIQFQQMLQTAKAAQEIKLSEADTIKILGYSGQMGYQGEKKVIKFIAEQYVFVLTAGQSIAWDELKKVAESLSKMAPDDIEVYYKPSYLPEGYQKTGGERVDTIEQYMTFSNGKTNVTFVQSVLEGVTSIDSENMKRKIVDINGWKGQLNYRKNRKLLIWTDSEYVFSLFGDGKISNKELLKMAREIAPTE